jgi:hypothetical protein
MHVFSTSLAIFFVFPDDDRLHFIKHIGFARNYYRQRAIYWVERAAMCKRKKTAWTTTREDGGESSSFC